MKFFFNIKSINLTKIKIKNNIIFLDLIIFKKFLKIFNLKIL